MQVKAIDVRWWTRTEVLPGCLAFVVVGVGGYLLVPALHSQAHTLKRVCVHGSCMPVIYDGTQHSSPATAAPSCGQGAWNCWCWLCCAGMLVAGRESRRWFCESFVR